jgi:Na+-transporting methylmalonyl-CoA/oxaloacetate decarboxylase gamma subunit
VIWVAKVLTGLGIAFDVLLVVALLVWGVSEVIS